jgi:hypothetical protein
MPIASVGKPIASIGISKRYPRPTPTPPVSTGDLLKDLCTAASREVEASRLVIQAQKEYQVILERQVEAQKSIIADHVALNESNKENRETLKAIVKKSEEIETTYKEQLANKDKEIEILKKKKCGFVCQATRVVIGVGIGVLLL